MQEIKKIELMCLFHLIKTFNWDIIRDHGRTSKKKGVTEMYKTNWILLIKS